MARLYTVRTLKIGRTAQMDALAHAAGELYSQVVVWFWRTVRHKDLWLKAKHLLRWLTSALLHAHSSDAVVQSFHGPAANQRLHQMPSGIVRHMLTYKAERLGMQVVLVGERYTTQTCPACGMRSKPGGRVYRCRSCGFTFHRDGVGAIKIRRTYTGSGLVVGAMASPIGVRYQAHLRCCTAFT